MSTKITPVTEEEWLECHQWNRMIIEEFLQQQHLSNQTLKQYRSSLRIFARWVHDNCMNKAIYQLKPRDALRYQNYLLEIGLSSSAVKFKRSSVSTMCNYIEVYYSDEDECKTFRNIYNKAIPSPAKSYAKEKEYLSKEDLDKLLKTLEKNKEYQMLAYVLLSYTSGARRAEIAQMKKEFFDMPKLKGKDFYQTPKVRGKGGGKVGKQINLIYDEKARKAVKKWLEVRGEDDCEYVFVYKTKSKVEPLSPDAFNGWFTKKFNDILGFPSHPHMLRRSRATHMVKEDGKDIEKARALLNHASSEVTKHYVMRDEAEDLDDIF